MRPKFYDFVNLFEDNITVDYIASDLMNWDPRSESRIEALERMADLDFDLLGIIKKDKVI